MQTENRLKKSRDFKIVYKKGKSYANRDFVVYIKKNNLEHARVGFSVSKKVGKAWKRNEIKRRLREIIRLKPELLKKNYDIIVIVRKTIKGTDYNSLEKSFNHVLKGSDLAND